MRSTLVLAVCALVVCGALAGATAVASAASASAGMHGNHLSVDPQVTSDGTVVVETAFTLRPGFVVLRADDGGEPGEPVGHTAVRGGEFLRDVPVAVNESTWSEWDGNRTLWAVLHRDDGDGEFDLADDRAMTDRNPAARARLSVRRGEGEGADRVLAADAQFQPIGGTGVTVRRVDLSADGYVAVESLDGEVVGTQRLPAGTHSNVTVVLDESFVADQSDRFRVRAVAYHDDGDGLFDPSDRRVTAGGQSVGTSFTLEKGEEEDGSIINTPAGTPIPSETPTGTATVTATATATAPAETPTDSATTTESSESGPGFGVVAALVALLAVAFVARRRL